jgi:ribonuclease P protein component
MASLARLKRRAEFLAVAATRHHWAAPGLVLQAARRPADSAPPAARVGFTASRKVGMAVERNRARRRLKAAAQEILGRHAAPEHDYVLIARRETLKRPFRDLLGDLETALRRLHAWRDVPVDER